MQRGNIKARRGTRQGTIVQTVYTTQDGCKISVEKNGPKPESKKNTDESTWLMRYSFDTANSLEVNIKVGSRECGLNAVSDDGKISELSLKKKYS